MRDPSWDQLVSSHPDCTFFHSSPWAKVLHETYGFTPTYLLATEAHAPDFRLSAPEPATCNLQPATHSRRLIALLPAMDVSSPFTGRRGVSLPFTDACPPLLSESIPLSTLLRQLTALAKERGWNYWECRGVKCLPSDARASLSFYGHNLDFSATDENGLFQRFRPTLRTAIRKAEQAGVQVEVTNSIQAVQTFYALHCKTRRKHGLPPQPFRFFRAIHRHILSHGLGRVVIARIHQTPIAANLYFHSGTKAIYKYGASDDSFQDLRASNLVMWRAIQSYAAQGYQSLDFGRTSTTADGLRRFKLAWGSREERIDYLRYVCRKDAFITAHDEASGWYNSIMTRMPLPLLRIIGAALYRHIA